MGSLLTEVPIVEDHCWQASKFHVNSKYEYWNTCFSIMSWYILKSASTRRRFQQWEGPSRDLLRILWKFCEASLTTLSLATHSADKTRWRDAEIFYKTSKLSYISFEGHREDTIHNKWNTFLARKTLFLLGCDYCNICQWELTKGSGSLLLDCWCFTAERKYIFTFQRKQFAGNCFRRGCSSSSALPMI